MKRFVPLIITYTQRPYQPISTIYIYYGMKICIHKTKTKQQQKENNPKMAVLIQKYVFSVGTYSCVFLSNEARE